MRFESPKFLLIVLLAILFFLVWIYLNRKRKQSIEGLFSKQNILNLGLIDYSSVKKNLLARFLLILSFSFFAVALARPQFGQRQKSVDVRESSVVFLIDLSRSMLTKDIKPSRLELVKEEIKQALSILADVKIGLVIFAGSVDVLSPMTSDKEAIESYVESLGVDAVSSQGTKIVVGLEEAKALFDRSLGEKSEGSKLIVLFSDGESHETESVEYAEKISDEGFKILTVGVGTEEGGYVPESERSNSYIKDVSGQPVISKPNFSFLKSLASSGEGAFYYLSPISPLGPKIKANLDKLDTVSASKRKFLVRSEAYQVFLLLGLFFILLSVFVRRF